MQKTTVEFIIALEKTQNIERALTIMPKQARQRSKKWAESAIDDLTRRGFLQELADDRRYFVRWATINHHLNKQWNSIEYHRKQLKQMQMLVAPRINEESTLLTPDKKIRIRWVLDPNQSDPVIRKLVPKKRAQAQ